MRIVTIRRISQIFFLAVFLWFCVTATLGAAWYQLRGWPINWLLDLDPLTALATILATGTLYATLTWALVTIALTLFVGRFFCGFACPLGTLHQFTGWLGRERGLHFDGYHALWRWSVTDLEGFWQAVWDYFGIAASSPPARALGRRDMPGAQWFPGARLNYAEHEIDLYAAIADVKARLGDLDFSYLAQPAASAPCRVVRRRG